MAAQSVIHLTQSRYYSPIFNAAVFDGPIRIYFAQHQETLALQVYLRLQQHLKESYANFRNSFRSHGQTIFLMLYPSLDSFQESFTTFRGDANVTAERLGEDHILGVRGPLQEDQYEEVFEQIKTILQSLKLDQEVPSPLI